MGQAGDVAIAAADRVELEHRRRDHAVAAFGVAHLDLAAAVGQVQFAAGEPLAALAVFLPVGLGEQRGMGAGEGLVHGRAVGVDPARHAGGGAGVQDLAVQAAARGGIGHRAADHHQRGAAQQAAHLAQQRAALLGADRAAVLEQRGGAALRGAGLEADARARRGRGQAGLDAVRGDQVGDLRAARAAGEARRQHAVAVARQDAGDVQALAAGDGREARHPGDLARFEPRFGQVIEQGIGGDGQDGGHADQLGAGPGRVNDGGGRLRHGGVRIASRRAGQMMLAWPRGSG